MKRRAPRPQAGFYSKEPAVSDTKIAKKPPVPSQFTANAPPKAVPKHPARATGVAGFPGGGAKPKAAKMKATAPTAPSAKAQGPKLSKMNKFKGA